MKLVLSLCVLSATFITNVAGIVQHQFYSFEKRDLLLNSDDYGLIMARDSQPAFCKGNPDGTPGHCDQLDECTTKLGGFMQCDVGNGACFCQYDVPCPGGTNDCIENFNYCNEGAEPTCNQGPGRNGKCFCKMTNPDAACSSVADKPGSWSYPDPSTGKLCCYECGDGQSAEDCEEEKNQDLSERKSCSYTAPGETGDTPS